MSEQKAETIKNIRLEEIMMKNPHVLNVDEHFSRVWDMFQAYGIRHLPIVDKNGAVCGLITQRDLYRVASPRKTLDGDFFYDKPELDRHIVENVMTKDVFCLGPLDGIDKAIAAIVNWKYGCVPVVDAKRRPVGMITQIDILRRLAKYLSGA